MNFTNGLFSTEKNSCLYNKIPRVDVKSSNMIKYEIIAVTVRNACLEIMSNYSWDIVRWENLQTVISSREGEDSGGGGGIGDTRQTKFRGGTP